MKRRHTKSDTYYSKIGGVYSRKRIFLKNKIILSRSNRTFKRILHGEMRNYINRGSIRVMLSKRQHYITKVSETKYFIGKYYKQL